MSFLIYMDTTMYKLVCVVFACDAIEKYRQQIRDVRRTWRRQCQETVKLLFFLGEELHDPEFIGEDFIHLPGVGNDYVSASYKQNLGLLYVHQKLPPSEFYIVVGTDTYLNIPKMLNVLEPWRSQSQQALCIGGHVNLRKLSFFRNQFFFSGGPGIVINRAGLNLLAPYLSTMVETWKSVITSNEYLTPACDVALCYFAQNLRFKMVKLPDVVFRACNHKGFPCHQGSIFEKVDMIASCHLMTTNDFDEFTDILEKNQFFV